jgi:hypothetical protein
VNGRCQTLPLGCVYLSVKERTDGDGLRGIIEGIAAEVGVALEGYCNACAMAPCVCDPDMLSDNEREILRRWRTGGGR